MISPLVTGREIHRTDEKPEASAFRQAGQLAKMGKLKRGGFQGPHLGSEKYHSLKPRELGELEILNPPNDGCSPLSRAL